MFDLRKTKFGFKQQQQQQQQDLDSVQLHLVGAATQPVYHGLAGAVSAGSPAAGAPQVTSECWAPAQHSRQALSLSTSSSREERCHDTVLSVC